MSAIVDGTTKTLMVSENLHAWYWTYGLDNDGSNIKDAKHLFGFVWKNPGGVSAIERINGDKYYDKLSSGPPAFYGNICRLPRHV